jgi:hypothetical protein
VSRSQTVNGTIATVDRNRRTSEEHSSEDEAEKNSRSEADERSSTDSDDSSSSTDSEEKDCKPSLKAYLKRISNLKKEHEDKNPIPTPTPQLHVTQQPRVIHQNVQRPPVMQHHAGQPKVTNETRKVIIMSVAPNGASSSTTPQTAEPNQETLLVVPQQRDKPTAVSTPIRRSPRNVARGKRKYNS